MSAAPVEFRYYHRLFTLDDVRKGIPPIVNTDGKVYKPNVLQFRYKMKITDANGISMVWSDWEDVPVVLEGAE